MAKELKMRNGEVVDVGGARCPECDTADVRRSGPTGPEDTLVCANGHQFLAIDADDEEADDGA